MKKKQLLVIAATVLLLVSCSQPRTSPTPIPTNTPTAAPAKTSTVAPTATLAPTATPAERATVGSTRIAGTATTTPTPELTDLDFQMWSSTSPDGEWTAQVTVALPVIDGRTVGENYYTQLKLTRTDETPEWTVVDEWSRWALGYTTPQPFRWSRDGRHLYLTNRPVPDGCGVFANGSDLQRIDLTNGSVTEVVPSVGLVLSLSPDEATLAYVGYRGRGLVLRDLTTGEEQPVNLDIGAEDSLGSIVWSPNGTALMLAVAANPCGSEDQRAYSVVRVDIATLSSTTLIHEDARLFTPGEWPTAEQVLLIDKDGNPWWMEPTTGQVVRKK